MKKILLNSVFMLATLFAHSQVSSFVLEPASLAGGLEFTWAEPPAWGTNDLEVPASSIMDTLAIALGAGGDTIGCDPGGIVSDVAGKIAVLWRFQGGCTFTDKALAAQNAGAVGVVIINDTIGDLVELGQSTLSGNVTIPTIMIGKTVGQTIYDSLEVGATVVMFIGNKNGIFQDDLTLFSSGILLPPETARPTSISRDATDYSTEIGSFVFNFGSSEITGATLSCEITDANDVVVYSETSTLAISLPSLSSIFVQLPDFALPSYGGFYEIVYSVSSDEVDPFLLDNEYTTNLLIDTIFAKSLINESDGFPETDRFLSDPNVQSGARSSNCLLFQDPNASRLVATGIFASMITSGTTIVGESLFSEIWQWDDPFVDVQDAFFGFDAVSLLEEGEFVYDSDDQEGEQVWIQVFQPGALLKIMFVTFSVTLFKRQVFSPGYAAESTDYTQRVNFSLQPVAPVYRGNLTGTWRVGAALDADEFDASNSFYCCCHGG